MPRISLPPADTPRSPERIHPGIKRRNPSSHSRGCASPADTDILLKPINRHHHSATAASVEGWAEVGTGHRPVVSGILSNYISPACRNRSRIGRRGNAPECHPCNSQELPHRIGFAFCVEGSLRLERATPNRASGGKHPRHGAERTGRVSELPDGPKLATVAPVVSRLRVRLPDPGISASCGLNPNSSKLPSGRRPPDAFIHNN